MDVMGVSEVLLCPYRYLEHTRSQAVAKIDDRASQYTSMQNPAVK